MKNSPIGLVMQELLRNYPELEADQAREICRCGFLNGRRSFTGRDRGYYVEQVKAVLAKKQKVTAAGLESGKNPHPTKRH